MNFFERQATVRRQSRRLVFYFILAVIAVVGALNLVVQLILTGMGNEQTTVPADTRIGLGAIVTVVATALILGASAFQIASLRRGGGGKVARTLGATPVPPDTTDPQLRRLRNIVEEIAVASTLPVPEIYVMQGEQGINAFAAGHTPADAAVAVTTGALERLNRNELEGVIAHEFSHIANGDMRLNLRLIGTLFGIEAMAIVGRTVLRGAAFSSAGRRSSSRGRNNNGAGAIIIIGLAAMIIGYIGVFMGRVIKAAVSRQREYLADASAVQFTRQTEGLAGALKKIGGLDEGSKLQNGKVDEVSHMLFGDGLKLSSMFATHPPVVKRIQELEPSFQPENLEALRSNWQSSPPSGMAEDQAMGLAEPQAPRHTTAAADSHTAPAPTTTPPEPSAATQWGLPEAEQAVTVDPARVAAGTAAPGSSSFEQAGTFLASLPDDLKDRAHNPATALPLVLGLLLATDGATRTQQHTLLSQQLGQQVADAAWQEADATANLPPLTRLPLAEIAFPALRHREDRELEAVAVVVESLIWVDGQLTPYEYCLSRLLHRDLLEAARHTEPRASHRRKLASANREVTVLLSALAALGHQDPLAAQHAYDAGRVTLGMATEALQPPREGIMALEGIWSTLDELSWPERGRLIEALVAVAAHDGTMTVEEIELLRLVGGMLHCPIPLDIMG